MEGGHWSHIGFLKPLAMLASGDYLQTRPLEGICVTGLTMSKQQINSRLRSQLRDVFLRSVTSKGKKSPSSHLISLFQALSP